MIQADLLTCGAGKRTEGSDRPGESSLSAVCDFPSSYISTAEAGTERSEGVAGAERYQGPGQPAADRDLAASGSEWWARPEARSVLQL